ncbi:MAG: DnaT-like ssDNA-binding domain-containing protein, partial [Marinobacterium sp.]|nr:DnaT-like ssDNA-binding domain-containing protein [Marinobacterium sp.]
SDKTFQMVWNWAPFDVGKFSDDLVLEGVDWESLTAEVQELIRVEFVSYWMARGVEYSQAVWEHKFTGAVKYQVGRGVQRLQVTQQGVQG